MPGFGFFPCKVLVFFRKGNLKTLSQLKDGSLQGTGGRKPPAYLPQDHKVLEQLASTQLGNLPLKTPTNSPSASGLGTVDVVQAVFIPLMKSHFHSMFFPVFRDIKRDVLELTHPVDPSQLPQTHCIALYTTPNKLDVHFARFKTKWTGHNVVKQSRNEQMWNVGAYSCQELKREPAWMFSICISSWLLLKRKAKLLGNMLDFFCKYWATVLQNHNHYCYTQCKNTNIRHSRFSTI